MQTRRIDDSPKCDDRNRPIHIAGQLPDCPTCIETRRVARESWKPPLWQLVTPHGTFDYDRRPWNPIVRLAMYLRGYRWRKNPALMAFVNRAR